MATAGPLTSFAVAGIVFIAQEGRDGAVVGASVMGTITPVTSCA